MAPSKADLARIAAALNRLSDHAKAALVAALKPGEQRIPTTRGVLDAWLAIVEAFGSAAAALGADQFERAATELGLAKPATKLVRGSDPARAEARARWALSQPNQLGNLKVILDELVKQPYRSTIAASAFASGVKWARVPFGLTCDWCLMLASRGAVYESAESAGATNKYHGECDCIPTLIRGPQDYPPGYDPGQLYREYKARQARKTLIIPKSAQVEPHELDTAAKIAARGHKVEFLPAANIQGVKTPDLLVDGEKWEMKAPQGSGRHTISHQMERASKQSDRLILDTSRTPLDDQQIVDEVRRRVIDGRSGIRIAWVVLKNGTWVEIEAPRT